MSAGLENVPVTGRGDEWFDRKRTVEEPQRDHEEAEGLSRPSRPIVTTMDGRTVPGVLQKRPMEPEPFLVGDRGSLGGTAVRRLRRLRLNADAMSSLRRSLASRPIGRPVAILAAAGLLVVAIIHVIDGSGSLHNQLYVGGLELCLAVASVPLAVLLAARPLPLLWHAAGALCTAALLAYVASRTTGLPGAADDIGNRGQPLGVLTVAVEVAVITAAGLVIWSRRRSAG